MLEVIKSLG